MGGDGLGQAEGGVGVGMASGFHIVPAIKNLVDRLGRLLGLRRPRFPAVAGIVHTHPLKGLPKAKEEARCDLLITGASGLLGLNILAMAERDEEWIWEQWRR